MHTDATGPHTGGEYEKQVNNEGVGRRVNGKSLGNSRSGRKKNVHHSVVNGPAKHQKKGKPETLAKPPVRKTNRGCGRRTKYKLE